MLKALGWAAVVALCCAASAVAGETVPDARLQQAQTAYEEAKRLDQAGKYAEAVAQAEQALSLRESVLGDKHPEVADCLDLLGALYRFQGEFDRAEPLIQRGLAIREGAFGQNHPDVAQSLNNLANIYQAQGLYDRAEPLYQRSLAIREATLGKNHPSVAASLNNLAVLNDRQGRYSRAEPLYQRALAIREAAFDKDHPIVATSLNNLAILYAEQGLYSRAEPLYQRALRIREAALGKNHPDLAASLGNLANLYSDQGMYSRAEPFYQRALALKKEAAFGKDHPDIAIHLNNLAVLYDRQGLYSRAEPLYQRALEIREATLGKNHHDVAASLNNLADVYAKQGAYGRAEQLHQRSLAIYEAVFGKTNPEVGQTLNSLARVYAEQGQYSRAEPLYQRALATNEATLGKNHPAVARSLNDLATLQLARRRLAAAVPLLARAFAMSEQRLRHEALDFSEARLASFLQLLRADEERLYAVVQSHPNDASMRRLALSAALLLKGRSMEETAHISRAVYRGLGSQGRDTFERLRGLRTQLASLSLQGPGSRPLPVYQKQLRELAEQGDALEADLAQRSAPLRALTALPSPAVIVDRVAQSLPKDSALIEFIYHEDHSRVPKPGEPKAQLRYLALVLFPNATTVALDLGPAEPIDSTALHLRAALANRDVAFHAHAQTLYQLAFRPLLPLLGKTRRLFLSPDGQLSLVPFSALHDGRQFLVESFDFTYLTSGKDLLPRLQETAHASSVVVLAAPDFDAPLQPPDSFQGGGEAQKHRAASLEHFFSSLREGSAPRAWVTAPLPGTRNEAEAIQRLLPQAQLFLGANATKQRLLNLPTPGILHLATHGFFLEDAAAPDGSRGVGHFGALGEEPAASRPPDPLLRSGLLLAGASAATASSRAPSENALVTALELASLDLWGTQLVVLSACDTGRGDVKMGQGVYGMRRAFIVAGAETVVTSLWKVDDQTTSTLMEAYYRNLLAGQGRATALREAMRALRTTQPHPHFWAPFIALGKDAPLRSLSPGTLNTPQK
ncbi:CHAT domain-containing tetratricopeptide repeat protein [Hyalangium rubrum]|uniref:CHAT domain-containing tetratricopeptide repeat protein n=1 Tax=Hyalangium rubrum TaxID=3103134 RepID=A0ABU5HAL0_9BACT|nr:CHAT domain-containing tetratricopeptide repeat protein [Hyalangium sp. s54d21]MDY7229150.1 CHAT domain-containing tetratricopeptide repeat protein [Hyalangium sp. s54d21]